MPSLSRIQQRHVQMTALLIQYARFLGYEMTWGDAYRDPRVHGEYGEKESYAAARSQHKRRLAVDLNVFKLGNYLGGEAATEAHNKLHDFWDLLGGDARIPDDLNHYQYTE